MSDHPTPPYTIGLTLGGGGLRGLAHIGVLQVLEEAGIPFHLITGTSMGGLIAGIYACGLSPAEIEQEALFLSSPRNLVRLLDRARLRRGLIQADNLMAHLRERVGDPTFEQLRWPLALVAVDLNTGRKIVLRDGPVLSAVRATTAVPGIFTPVERDAELLVDGGLIDNLPADVAREMGADLVIAVDVTDNVQALDYMIHRLMSAPFVPDGLADTLTVIARSYTLLIQEANRHCLECGRPDVLIRPRIPEGVTLFTGFGQAADVIQAGVEAARAALPIIQRLVAARTIRQEPEK